MAAPIYEDLPGQSASFPKYGWQVETGRGPSWTDFGAWETQRLEAAWTTQLWSTTEISMVFEGVAGWQDYIFHLGKRLQQVNIRTGKIRNMRRMVVLQESLVRASPFTRPEPPVFEEQESPRSEGF